MAWLLVFLAGSTFGSLVTTVAVALCMAAREGDRQLEQIDAQQQWRDEVQRLLKEAQ